MIIEAARDVQENTEIYAPFIILPLDSIGASQSIMQIEENTRGLSWPTSFEQHRQRTGHLDLVDSLRYILKSGPGGIKSEGSSELTNTGVHAMLTSEQGMSLHGEHIAEHRVLAKGSNRGNTQEEPTSSPNTLIKSKVSRAPRTGSASALESSNIQPSSTTFPSWPPKNSRSRRVKVVSPASRNIEVQVSSEGCITSDFNVKPSSAGNNGFQHASSVDKKTRKKWKEFIISNSWPPLWREKSENVPTMKPVQDMKPNDKSRTPWLFGSIFASISLDDASYLKQQVNIAEEFDKKSLSPMFGIDHDLLGVVINNKSTQGSEERKRSHCDEESTKFDALGGKKDMERLDKLTPLFQRLLCALIEQDESQESYDQVMQRIYLDNVLVIILTMVLVIKLILNPKIEIEWILKLNQR
ncbi:hypothetical protein JHK82_040089 [Glycine max]|nr:hypothetical protein JHK82_040089 [Glycine max]KAG5122162.1 hypothetical protein JHK84_040502 [Glycine max]